MKDVMKNLTYGLCVLSSVSMGKHNACIINAVMQVTSSPNRICFAVNKSNLTHDMLRQTGHFTISILDQTADFELFRHFGFQSGQNCDKFRDYPDCRLLDNWTMCVTKDVNSFLSGEVIQEIDAGTHTLFLADVTESGILSDVPSLSYAYYQEHVKPKPETAEKIGTTESGQTIWRCSICGYEYIGDELPEDFICPLCKHPATDFEKIN
ncbi:MAG: flavin reductase [Oscillospiraceae bacterium]|nr:flavin reductase [Oscillospiraceae bacterium]